MFALAAGADFEIGNSYVVDFGWEKKLQRVKPKDDPVGEFDQREPIVKDFICCFLAFTVHEMSDH